MLSAQRLRDPARFLVVLALAAFLMPGCGLVPRPSPVGAERKLGAAVGAERKLGAAVGAEQELGAAPREGALQGSTVAGGLTVELDGIVVQPGRETALEALDAILAERGLVPGPALPDPWRSYVAERPRELAAWFELLRELRVAAPDALHTAGLLATSGPRGRRVLLTDQLVVNVRAELEPEAVARLADRVGASSVVRQPLHHPSYLFAGLALDPLAALELLEREEDVRLAYPDLTSIDPDERGLVLVVDPLLAEQWHHDNDGLPSGRFDADIDTPLAWDLLGAGSTPAVLAVVDRGFEADHPDLKDNLWNNPFELNADCLDGGDGNEFPDDMHGWDFRKTNSLWWTVYCKSPSLFESFHPRYPLPHGTAVAGLAAAVRDNGQGGAGVCPGCELMLVHRGAMDSADAQAVQYAAANADVINMSFGYEAASNPNLVTALEDAACQGRGGKGCVVIVAMSSGGADDCVAEDLSALDAVIGVSASDDGDRRHPLGGIGECMEVLAPGRGVVGSDYVGPITTDYTGPAGLNSDGTIAGVTINGCASEVGATSYTSCFFGTSASAAIASGVAGLVLSAAPELTSAEVRRLLMDTADRIDPSSAAYDTATGRSSNRTHGSGRVNAFEAVRVVAPVADGGRGGVDVFVRDNQLDWGNTERPSSHRFDVADDSIAHWKSPDVKVDAPEGAGSLSTDLFQPPASSLEFDAFQHESPIQGRGNKVYVRVRNRGPVSAAAVNVSVYWVFAGTALPTLPTDFWTQGVASSTVWHSLGTQTVPVLPYCGSAVAGVDCAAPEIVCGVAACDAAAVLTFDFQAPPIDPSRARPDHYCLFVVVDTADDPVAPESKLSLVPDWITPRDNNVTQRNVALVYPTVALNLSHSTPFEFYLTNPFPCNASFDVRWKAELGTVVELDAVDPPLALEPGERRLVHGRITWPPEQRRMAVDVIQESLVDGRPLIGGMTFELRREGR